MALYSTYKRRELLLTEYDFANLLNKFALIGDDDDPVGEQSGEFRPLRTTPFRPLLATGGAERAVNKEGNSLASPVPADYIVMCTSRE